MEQGPEALMAAIRAATTGSGEPDFELLLQYLNDSDAIHLGSQVFLMRLGELSEKEQAVLDLFEAMTPFEQIAETLDLQRYRVRQIFEKVMRRCGFATRSQLYLALFEAGKGNG
jgi:DNA-binding NarL/FixJ family response regulator